MDLAKELSPAIIAMEDIDASFTRHTIDVLKTEMDGVSRSSGITTILTTNHPKSFPEALLDRPGRFHDVLKFDLPEDGVRKAMLEKWLPDLSTKACLKAVSDTKGYSGAHVYELCEYAKSLREQDEIGIDDAVTKALRKIADQRELINQELMSGRTYAERRRSFEADPPPQAPTVTKSFVSEGGELKSPRTFSDVETEYLAALAKADTDVLRKAHRHVSLILRSAEELEEARELDSLMSVLQ
jgi:SpoVK/Ycf46/Vps4 family AAA+-type ATPase